MFFLLGKIPFSYAKNEFIYFDINSEIQHWCQSENDKLYIPRVSNGGKDKEKKRKPPTYTSMLNVAKTFKCDCFIPSVSQPFIGKHDLQRTKPNVTITELLSWEFIGSILRTSTERKNGYTQTILSATKYTKWRMTIGSVTYHERFECYDCFQNVLMVRVSVLAKEYI